jgi:hypothetical protein
VVIEGQEFTFKLDTGYIKHEGDISAYNIMPASVRAEMDAPLRARSKREGSWRTDVRYSDIKKITYKKKVIYTSAGN